MNYISTIELAKFNDQYITMYCIYFYKIFLGLEQDGTIDKNKMKNWYNSNTQEGVQMVFHKKTIP